MANHQLHRIRIIAKNTVVEAQRLANSSEFFDVLVNDARTFVSALDVPWTRAHTALASASEPGQPT